MTKRLRFDSEEARDLAAGFAADPGVAAVRKARREAAMQIELEKARRRYMRSKDGRALKRKEEGQALRALGVSIRCAICDAHLRGKSIVMDHCHASGETREVLCRQCNVGLGMFRDNPELIEHAARYLRKHAHLKGETEPQDLGVWCPSPTSAPAAMTFSEGHKNDHAERSSQDADGIAQFAASSGECA